MSDYTPSTEEIRRTYLRSGRAQLVTADAEFNRWLAQVKADAIKEAGDFLEACYPTDIWPEGNETTDRIGASMGRANARALRHYAEQTYGEQA